MAGGEPLPSFLRINEFCEEKKPRNFLELQGIKVGYSRAIKSMAEYVRNCLSLLIFKVLGDEDSNLD